MARKTIAQNMSHSAATIPHVTDHDDADITDLGTFRKGYASATNPERKLRLLPFAVRAVARALQAYPIFNASFDHEKSEIVYHKYINIAIGMQTNRGLVTPVIRDADRLGVIQIADVLEEMTNKARGAGFAVADMRGATFTISNAGAMGGSRYSTPIIVHPQSAVIALGRARPQPWVKNDCIVPRIIQPLSVSFDHRIIDGADEIAFMHHIIDDLESPARLAL
jgi:pyruvate dehydrogenase E2 component (dihydrolipoamide acetyltransferase)